MWVSCVIVILGPRVLFIFPVFCVCMCVCVCMRIWRPFDELIPHLEGPTSCLSTCTDAFSYSVIVTDVSALRGRNV